MAENLEQLPGLKEGQQVITPIGQPIKATGHLQVLPQTLPELVPTVLRVCSGPADGEAAGHHTHRRIGNGHRPPAGACSAYLLFVVHLTSKEPATLVCVVVSSSAWRSQLQGTAERADPQPCPPSGMALQQAGWRMRVHSIMPRVTLAARSAAGMQSRSASTKARGARSEGLSIFCSGAHHDERSVA